MKTITRNNLSVYLLEDSVPVEITPTHTFIGIEPGIVVSDCKIDTALLHENVTTPDAWDSNKYFYINGEWIRNPDYVDPPPPPAQPIATGTQDL